MGVAHGAVFAGAGQDFGAGGGDGELVELKELQRLSELEHLHEALVEQGLVLAAEGANRVVIRMSVGGEQAHGHAVVSALLDAAAAEGAGGVTVNEQPQQHPGRVLFAAGAAGVDADLAQVQAVHRVEDEVDEMIGGHPVAQVGREQQGRVVIQIDEAGGHEDRIDLAPVSFKETLEKTERNRTG